MSWLAEPWVGWTAVAVGVLVIACVLVDQAVMSWRARRADRRGGMLEVLPGPGLTVVPEPGRPFDWDEDCSDWFGAA